MTGYRVDWAEAETIAFGEKLASSRAFMTLFREGMSLIEETAAYLDGPGRRDSRELTRSGMLAYATESMRLTTRLMQLASWLLLQRAVNEGEMSRDQARADKAKIKIRSLGPSRETPATDEMPAAFKALVERSLRLEERIVHLDELLYSGASPAPPGENPVERDIARLQAAFGQKS